MFAATSALGISWENLNHPNLLVRAVYRFHAYFRVRLILHELGISLPYENRFSKVKKCMQWVWRRSDQDIVYGDWFYTTGYAVFGHKVKATERSAPDNLTG